MSEPAESMPRFPELDRFRLGEWSVRRAEGVLCSGDRSVRLEPRVMDVLVHLATDPGKVVSKEELLEAVWGGAFVEEGALSQAIHSIRKALGDEARQPRYVQTIPKRGYRLVVPVEPESGREALAEASSGPMLEGLAPDSVPAAWWARRPLSLLLVLVVALVLWIVWAEQQRAGQANTKASEGIRIVVLPFESLGEPKDPYFAAGLTEEITANLTLLPTMQVVPGRTALGDKGITKPPLEIAEELKADYVLLGRVGWWGQRVRVRPTLIRTKDEAMVWIAPFMGDANNPFIAQQEISRAVISTLDITLTPEQRMAVGERSTKNLEAYRAYLQGLVLKDQPFYSPPHLEQAAMMFEQAVKIDEGFAEAWAELSKVHSYLAFNTDRTAKRRELARYSMERAVVLRPNLVATRLAQAYFLYRCQQDYGAALEQLAAAANISPNTLEVIEMRGLLLRRTGRLLEAIEMLKRASALKPRAAYLVWTTAETYRALRDYEQADAYYEQAMSLAPDTPFNYEERALNHLCWTGSPSEARAILEDSPVPESHELQFIAFYLDLYERKYQQALSRLSSPRLKKLPLADQSRLDARAVLAQERMGKHEEALSLAKDNLSTLKLRVEKYPQNQIYVAYMAVALAQLGFRDEAIAQAEKAVLRNQHDAFSGPQIIEIQAMVDALLGRRREAVERLRWLLSKSYRGAICSTQLELDPVWDPLRGDKGFEELVSH